MKYFDLHCDTATVCYDKKTDFYGKSLAVSGDEGLFFDLWEQCFAVWIKDDMKSPFEYYKSVIGNFKNLLKDAPQNLNAHFTVEGGVVLEDDISRLEILKNDSVKALTLTWNGKNRIASGCYASGGLTDFGVRVIDKMNSLKIACDLSHINEEGFWDALGAARFPFASHSNCISVCEHPRNISDIQIKAIAESGGIIGLCFYPPFLGCDVFEGIYRNIFHLCDMGLENNISIGSDFDGGEMSEKLDKPRKIYNLKGFLLSKGIDNALISKIFYENSRKFFLNL